MTGAARWKFAGALGIYSAGGLFWAFLPYFVGLQIAGGGMTEAQAGLLGSAYLMGFSGASLTAVWWVSKVNWRVLTMIGTAVIIASFWLLQGLTVYIAQLLSVALIGISMGSFWSIAYRIFGASENPDRSFAMAIVVSYIFLAAISYTIGRFIAPSYGLAGSALVLSIVLALLAISVKVLPKGTEKGESETVVIDYRPPVPLALALLGLLATGLAFAAVWAFAERIGVAAGFDESQISPAIAGNLLASAAGSTVATLIGSRKGRGLPLMLGLFLFAGCILLLTQSSVFLLYALGVTGLGFFVGFVLPYQMGAISSADTAGRFVVMIAAAQGLGSAMGTYGGGMVFDLGGARLLAGFAAATLVVSALLFAPILKAGTQR